MKQYNDIFISLNVTYRIFPPSHACTIHMCYFTCTCATVHVHVLLYMYMCCCTYTWAAVHIHVLLYKYMCCCTLYMCCCTATCITYTVVLVWSQTWNIWRWWHWIIVSFTTPLLLNDRNNSVMRGQLIIV